MDHTYGPSPLGDMTSFDGRGAVSDDIPCTETSLSLRPHSAPVLSLLPPW